MRSSRIIVALVALTALAAPALAGTYVGGGTFVAKTQYGTVLDNGGAICRGTNGAGIGGGCLLFPDAREGGFVEVVDGSAGRAVAFQVCIDNNGDGVCGGPQTDSRCFDQIFFSHNDEGRFFNPLGPLPTSKLPGCASATGGAQGFNGYVVLLCQGAHEPSPGASHAHALTSGSISLATKGSGYGDFCGGGFGGGTPTGQVNAAAKAYVVE